MSTPQDLRFSTDDEAVTALLQTRSSVEDGRTEFTFGEVSMLLRYLDERRAHYRGMAGTLQEDLDNLTTAKGEMDRAHEAALQAKEDDVQDRLAHVDSLESKIETLQEDAEAHRATAMELQDKSAVLKSNVRS